MLSGSRRVGRGKGHVVESDAIFPPAGRQVALDRDSNVSK